MSTSSNIPEAAGNVPAVGTFEQPVLAIVDPATFAQVRGAIATVFSAPRVNDFMKSLDRNKFRIRDFQAVSEKGLLGKEIPELYSKLSPGDQGQIREFYLASVEHAAPELRKKYFKLYSYY